MQTKKYYQFWENLHKKAYQTGSLLRVMFEVTYECNFKCQHCYVPLHYRDKEKELTTKQVYAVLDQLKELGCFYLGFTGGEPFMRSDFIDIVWYAKKCGFQIIIYSNASCINEKIVRELVRIGINKIDITVPAIKEKTFKKITGVNAKKKVFDAIECLYKNNVPLGLKTCILQDNEREFEEIRSYALLRTKLYRFDTVVSRRLDGSDFPLQYKTLKNFLNPQKNTQRCSDAMTVKDVFPKKADAVRYHMFSSCGVGRISAAITPGGELKMCPVIDYPKYTIQGTSLAKAWDQLKKHTADISAQPNKECEGCSVKQYCTWCPARSWLETKTFNRCDSVSRFWAEQRRKFLTRS